MFLKTKIFKSYNGLGISAKKQIQLQHFWKPIVSFINETKSRDCKMTTNTG